MENSINIVFLGTQNSGKTTQAKMIADRFGMCCINTTELLRTYKQKENISDRIISMLDAGDLIDDFIVMDLVKYEIEKRIEDNSIKNGFIFDGFPRTDIQAQMLDDILGYLSKNIDLVFSFESIKDSGTGYILSDIEEVSIKSINNYIFHKESILNFYKGKTVIIEPTNSITNVFNNISSIIIDYRTSKHV